jgi:hypothetical protein
LEEYFIQQDNKKDDKTSTIFFCDFCHFSAEKMALFSKTNVVIKFSQKLAIM